MTTTSMPAPAPLSRFSPSDSRLNAPARNTSPGPPAAGSESTQSATNNSSENPPVIVKHEPQSPSDTTTKSLPVPPSRADNPRRRRPQGLDLQQPTRVASAGSSLSKDPTLSNLALACLSPGFHTNDPALKETITRSLEVIDKQRKIIEARQNGKPDPPQSRRKGPPPRLSLRPSSHSLMSPNERAIRSAPLHSSFTGLNRPGPYPPMNHNESSSYHPHPGPSNHSQQPSNARLPPISNLLSNSIPGGPKGPPPSSLHQPTNAGYTSPRQSRPAVPQHVPAPPPPPPSQGHPIPSPSFRPPSAHGIMSHPRFPPPRDYQAPDDGPYHPPHDVAQRQSLYVHGRPPSPPSSAIHRSTFPPLDGAPNGHAPHYGPSYGAEAADPHRHGSSRRRPRDEYEREMGSPPLRTSDTRRPNPFSGPSDDDEAKKQQFLALCAQAWDLMRS